MKWELAKELKDAGFPQDRSQYYWDVIEKGADNKPYLYWLSPMMRATGAPYPSDTASPTLEELIEACIRQSGLSHFRLRLSVVGTWRADFDDDFKAFGSTPTEAAARLYLVLNARP